MKGRKFLSLFLVLTMIMSMFTSLGVLAEETASAPEVYFLGIKATETLADDLTAAGITYEGTVSYSLDAESGIPTLMLDNFKYTGEASHEFGEENYKEHAAIYAKGDLNIGLIGENIIDMKDDEGFTVYGGYGFYGINGTLNMNGGSLEIKAQEGARADSLQLNYSELNCARIYTENKMFFGSKVTGIVISDLTNTEAEDDKFVEVYGELTADDDILWLLNNYDNYVDFKDGSMLTLNKNDELIRPDEPAVADWIDHITGEGLIKITDESHNTLAVYNTNGDSYNIAGDELDCTSGEGITESEYVQWNGETKTLTLNGNTYIGDLISDGGKLVINGNAIIDSVYLPETAVEGLAISGSGSLTCSYISAGYNDITIEEGISITTQGIYARSLIVKGEVTSNAIEGTAIHLLGSLIREGRGKIHATNPFGITAIEILAADEDNGLTNDELLSKYVQLNGGVITNNAYAVAAELEGTDGNANKRVIIFLNENTSIEDEDYADDIEITPPEGGSGSDSGTSGTTPSRGGGGGGSSKHRVVYYQNFEKEKETPKTYTERYSHGRAAEIAHISAAGFAPSTEDGKELTFIGWSLAPDAEKLYYPGQKFEATKDISFYAQWAVSEEQEGYTYDFIGDKETLNALEVEVSSLELTDDFVHNVLTREPAREILGGAPQPGVQVIIADPYDALPDTMTINGVTIKEGSTIVMDDEEYLFMGIEERSPLFARLDENTSPVYMINNNQLKPVTLDGTDTQLAIAAPNKLQVITIGGIDYVLRYAEASNSAAAVWEKAYLYGTSGEVAGHIEAGDTAGSPSFFKYNFQHNSDGSYSYIPVYTPEIDENTASTKTEKEADPVVSYSGNNSWFNGVWNLQRGGVIIPSDGEIFGGRISIGKVGEGYGDAKAAYEAASTAADGTATPVEFEWQGGAKDEYNRPDIYMNGNASMYLNFTADNASGSIYQGIFPDAQVYQIDSDGNLVTNESEDTAVSKNYLINTDNGVKRVAISGKANVKISFEEHDSDMPFNAKVDVRLGSGNSSDRYAPITGASGSSDIDAQNKWTHNHRLGRAAVLHTDDKGNIKDISDVFDTVKIGGVEVITDISRTEADISDDIKLIDNSSTDLQVHSMVDMSPSDKAAEVLSQTGTVESGTVTAPTEGLTAKNLSLTGGVFAVEGSITVKNVESGSPFFILSAGDFTTETYGIEGVELSDEGAKLRYNPFYDVHPAHWFYDDALTSYEEGLINGISEHIFAPDNNITRGMLVTILHRAEGEPPAPKLNFTDVESGKYYTEAIAWALANGIVTGITDELFAPDDNITREQMAAILHRYARYKGCDVSVGESTNILSYEDFESISEYAIAPMQYAVGAGLIKGRTESTLNPKDNATRAETVTILQRFFNAIE